MRTQEKAKGAANNRPQINKICDYIATATERGIIMAKCTGVLCRMPDGYKVDECDCKDCPCRTEPITNSARFRAMSDEEQQNFVRKFLKIEDFADWLQQPAE